MAKQLTINFVNDQNFDRDINVIADAWGYTAELLTNPNITKQNFVEKKIKENLKFISKQLRTEIARQSVTVED